MVRDQFCETSGLASKRSYLDLNPIENQWGILARDVYKKGTQYANKNELTSSIEMAGKNISKQILIRLSESMIGRLITVIEKKGSFVEC